MIFQPLDEKRAEKIYFNGTIYDSMPPGACRTWRYNDSYPNSVEYASLYVPGKSLSEVCPEHLIPRWRHVSNKMSAHIRACQVAKIDLNSYGILRLVPATLFDEFMDLKNQITKHVFENVPKPKNYDFFFWLERLVSDIKLKKLNINLDNLRSDLTSERARSTYKRLLEGNFNIDYNIYKSKTGRLTTRKYSFPILTLDKSFRTVIEPNNDLLIELDFNAAELRTLLALSNKPQPKEDIHEWNRKEVYRGLITRDEAKKRIFAWLYNPRSKDYLSSRAYSRLEIIKKYFNGKQVETVFGRMIESDAHHALNYIVQSTTSDLLLKRAIDIFKLLMNKKSYIAFTLHDSLVIDFSLEDKDLLGEIIQLFKNTDLGEYAVNVSMGKNFKDMRRVSL
jgi:hypothetical protein